MAAGRPTSYQAEHAQRLVEFFTVDTEQYFLDEEGKMLLDKNDNPVLKPVKLPTLQRFAADIRVHIDTLYEWEKVHPEFSEALTYARLIQADYLMQGGLLGSYDRVITKLLLSSNHGIIEKTQVEHSGGFALTDRILEARKRAKPDDESAEG